MYNISGVTLYIILKVHFMAKRISSRLQAGSFGYLYGNNTRLSVNFK